MGIVYVLLIDLLFTFTVFKWSKIKQLCKKKSLQCPVKISEQGKKEVTHPSYFKALFQSHHC